MTVTTSSQDNGGSSFGEMARSYPTRWDRELASADLVAMLPLFLGDTGWRMPHPFRRTSRDAPDLFLPRAQQLSTGVWFQSIKRHVHPAPDERSADCNGDAHDSIHREGSVVLALIQSTNTLR
jgi:hypothetical protein